MSDKYYGRLDAENCALLVCDMQQKFSSVILHFDEIAENTRRMVEGCKLLNLPILITEQYPEGLGHTVETLGTQDIVPFAKTSFSMAIPSLLEHLQKNHPAVNTLILTGVEAHVCVINSAIDFIEKNGFNVHVLVDCCSSRAEKDRFFAFDRLRMIGVHLNTMESALLSLVKDKNHPQFKPVQKLIRQLGPAAGLPHA